MLPMTSPDDPVFSLHHCNIDRIWAQWRRREHPGEPYVPREWSDDWAQPAGPDATVGERRR
jgi:hypothetical protein